MIKRKLLLAAMVIGMTGCTDSVDSIAREYRNQNNEVIDALTMVTGEESAKHYNVRIFEPMVGRYQNIDARLNLVRTNRTKKEFAEEVRTSSDFKLYRAELEVNRQRFDKEMKRLSNLLEQIVKQERERLRNEGKAVPKDIPGLVCPVLNDLIIVNGKLDPLRKQLDDPRFLAMMRQIEN